MQLLTNSRSQSFKICRKRNHYAYELGLRPVTDPRALRIGAAFHLGLDALKQGKDVKDAIAIACRAYD
jgi:hypothetical protein